MTTYPHGCPRQVALPYLTNVVPSLLTPQVQQGQPRTLSASSVHHPSSVPEQANGVTQERREHFLMSLTVHMAGTDQRGLRFGTTLSPAMPRLVCRSTCRSIGEQIKRINEQLTDL